VFKGFVDFLRREGAGQAGEVKTIRVDFLDINKGKSRCCLAHYFMIKASSEDTLFFLVSEVSHPFGFYYADLVYSETGGGSGMIKTGVLIP
jgi:hypothetical protein